MLFYEVIVVAHFYCGGLEYCVEAFLLEGEAGLFLVGLGFVQGLSKDILAHSLYIINLKYRKKHIKSNTKELFIDLKHFFYKFQISLLLLLQQKSEHSFILLNYFNFQIKFTFKTLKQCNKCFRLIFLDSMWEIFKEAVKISAYAIIDRNKFTVFDFFIFFNWFDRVQISIFFRIYLYVLT